MIEISEDSPMQDITAAVRELSAAMDKIHSAYISAALLDPDYMRLREKRDRAYYYMRLKAGLRGADK